MYSCGADHESSDCDTGKRWTTQPLMHELREKAKAARLFNLFLPNHFKASPRLTNLEYSCCAELMGGGCTGLNR
jgi:hypothetical protein